MPDESPLEPLEQIAPERRTNRPDRRTNPVERRSAINIDRRENREDRRAKRDLVHWLVKLFAIVLSILAVASVGTMIYAAIASEKDLDTGFIAELFKTIIDFLHFILT